MEHSPPPATGSGILYVIATPIGHADDITVRALGILKTVDLLAAEDTRVARRLLSHHAIRRPVVSYHEHNEAAQTPRLIDRLQQGDSVALISDAGTPLLSDPGYRLVSAAIARGIRVSPIPGASAAVTALCAAGIPTHTFVFAGFLPKKKSRRAPALRELAAEPRTVVFYESPRRIAALVTEMQESFGDRYAVLAREMTKTHEEFIRGPLSAVARELERRPAVKGECTLMVAGSQDAGEPCLEAVRGELKKRIDARREPLSGIVRSVSEKYRLSKNVVYKEALHLKQERN